MKTPDRSKGPLSLVLALVLVVCGCSLPTSYRAAPQETIRDYSNRGNYLKKVGILALLNRSAFVGDQVTTPFMNAFLESIQSAAAKAVLVIPGETETASYLWNPPRIANGQLNVFTLSRLARQEGMNALASPILMDIRVRSRNTGFWIFRDVKYSLQIQTAAAIYDTITGTRLDLDVRTETIAIDPYDAERIRRGEAVIVDGLTEVVWEMGSELGERMGEAITQSQWLASVVAVEQGALVISAGSEAGIEAGDRFAVLDGSSVLTGLDGQRYIVPGVKIGSLTIDRVFGRQSLGTPTSGELPPTGSIVVPQ